MCFKKLLSGSKVVLVLILFQFFSLHVGALKDGPLTESQEAGDEWAPKIQLKLHPVYGGYVLLEKVSETPQVAYYKVSALVTPPKDTYCENYPGECILIREDN